MGIISDLLQFVSFWVSETNYLYQAEKWSDGIWNKMRDAYCGDGLLLEKDGKLYKRFRVTLNDGTTGVFFDEDDSGILINDLELKSYQKKELKRNSYFILKHYNG